MSQVIAIDLPWPPSVNHIWRFTGNRAYRSPEYKQWLNECHWIIKSKRLPKLEGEFSATIVLNPPNKRRNDIDNRIKCLLDLAEKAELIENDHFCRLLIVSYGTHDTAPLGARLSLTGL